MNDCAVRAEGLGKLFHHTLPRSRTMLGKLRRALSRSEPSFPVWALREVSFEVRRGECFGIAGPNGAGKSTLLALIAGILEPTRGEVRALGRMSPLFHIHAGLQAELSVRDNIEIFGILMGLRRREVLGRLAEILHFAELGRYADVRLGELSAGQAARVAFSTAVHSDPEILLVDELLAVGDVGFREKCLERFAALSRAGGTLLLVSHEPEYLRRLCSRTLRLREGRVEAVELGPAVEARGRLS